MNLSEDNAHTFSIIAETRIGGRSENQDSVLTSYTRAGLLAIVCDGMGGGPAGRTASSHAIETVKRYIDSQGCRRDKGALLREAISAAQERLLNDIRQDLSLKGMGSTAVVLLIDKFSACIAHVGDSRCYCLHNGAKAFRTEDHSMVGNLVREKKMTEEQARTAPNANVITRVIGIEGLCCPDIEEIPFCKGDRFVLCSDGVWGVFPEKELLTRLSKYESPSDTCKEIMDSIDLLGNQRACKYDNFSLILIDTNQDSEMSANGNIKSYWDYFKKVLAGILH